MKYLSSEVLNIDYDQGTAEISKDKVGGRKNIRRFSPGCRDASVSKPAKSAIIFRPSTLTSIFFAAPSSKSMISTSFERSISYLFGAKKQRPWHDFMV